MRTLRATILISRNEMKKNDFIETVLFIINKILDYSSSLDQIAPTLFDRKNIIKKCNEDISTSQSSNDDNLLILTMMNIDKILAKEFILTDDNVKNVLFTCMVITQKYYEDENFKDKDYSKLAQLKAQELIKMEIEFLSLIDFSLHISEEEFNKYKYRMEDIWKKKLSFLNFT